MKENTYNVDDVVNIYEDPITETNLEGVAKILECVGKRRYKVRFLSDNFVVVRFIK